MADPTDFDDEPPTVLDGPVPELLQDGDTSRSGASPEWRAGFEVGRAAGIQVAIDALSESLLLAGVAPSEVPAISARVRDRAEAILDS